MKKQKIKYHLSLLMGLSLLACSAQLPPSDFESAIVKLVTAFKEKDQATVNGFVSKKQGVIIVFRFGIFDQYQKTAILDFETPVPDYFPYYDFSTDYRVSFEPLPSYDCETFEWTKTGMYCDTTKTSHLLSKTAKNLNTYMDANISEKEIKSFEKLEKNSHRIVVCDRTEGEFIFYLTRLDKRWYLTLIDRVTTDCSS
ncbi:hypothetical protein ACFSQJ_03750 [Croceitalea marina]|uniref:Lipoprotein n=1 Tax=Croceitalea marina TaxID=1775166 RepID=A0ABW5MRZ4_9FLAO